MNALVEVIKRIGIFMIAAQAVIHFTPEQKYEKYIRLLVGIIILLQFVMPLHRIISGAEMDFSEQFADMEVFLEADGMDSMAGGTSGQSTLTESVINHLENEIKSKLNNEIAGEGYVVSGVQVSMNAIGEAGNREYAIEKVRVVVYEKAASAGNRMDGSVEDAGSTIEKIQIGKISIGGADEDGMDEDAPLVEATEVLEKQLRERFCDVLGMDVEKMEVSVYGTNEKTDR